MRYSLLFCALLLVESLSEGRTAERGALATLIEGAKKEQRVVWYATMNISDAKKIVDAFEKKYPFVKVDLYRAGSQPLLNRIASEYRGNRYLADVAETNIFESHIFQKKGFFQPYHSLEARFFPDQFKDPNGFWVADYILYFVIAYSTRFVKPSEAPKSYQDLLSPRWKGNIGLKDDAVRWYGALLEYWGEEKGRAYMTALARQNPRLLGGSYGLISELIAAGEISAGIVYAPTVESLRRFKGAPIDWESSVDPVVTSVIALYMLSKAPHPNSAKLFIDFFLSKETQQFLVTMNRVPARLDIEPVSPKLSPAKLKITVIRPEMSEKFERYSQEFKETFAK
jgi:ABC-type Fe3+ transport system substrate-binding protein